VSKYLNRKDVQQALHANLVGVDVWSTCSGLVLLLIYFCCYKMGGIDNIEMWFNFVMG
jgi:glutamine amidotransferase PdxT